MGTPLFPCQPMDTESSSSTPGPFPSPGPGEANPTLTQLRAVLPYWLDSLYEYPSLPAQHPLVVSSGLGESANSVCRWAVLSVVLRSHGPRDMAVATHLVRAVILLAEQHTASLGGWSSTERAACVSSGVLEALLASWLSVLPQPQPPQSSSPQESQAQDGCRRMLLKCCVQALMALLPALGLPATATATGPFKPFLPQPQDSPLTMSPTLVPPTALPAPLLDWCRRACGVALQCLIYSTGPSTPTPASPVSPLCALNQQAPLDPLQLLADVSPVQSWLRESACLSAECLGLLTLLWGAMDGGDKAGPHTQHALPLVLTAMHKHSWHDGVQLHGLTALCGLLLPPNSSPHSGVVSVGSEAASWVVAALVGVGPLVLPSARYATMLSCKLLQAMLPQMLDSSDGACEEGGAMQLVDGCVPQQLLGTATRWTLDALRTHAESVGLCSGGWHVLALVLPQCPAVPGYDCQQLGRLLLASLSTSPQRPEVVDACLQALAGALRQWEPVSLRGLLGVAVLSGARHALGPSLAHIIKTQEPLHLAAVLALTALLLQPGEALLWHVCGRRGGRTGGHGPWAVHVLVKALTSPSTPHALLPDACQALGVLCSAGEMGRAALQEGACEAVATLLLQTHAQLQDLQARQQPQQLQEAAANTAPDIAAPRGLCVSASHCLRALFSVDGDVSISRLRDRQLAHAFALALPYLNTPNPNPTARARANPPPFASRLSITSKPRCPPPSSPVASCVSGSLCPPHELSSTGLDPLLEGLLARPTTAARQRQELLQLTPALRHDPDRRSCLFKSGVVRGVMGALEAHPQHWPLQQAGLQALHALLPSPTEALVVLQQEEQALATVLANAVTALACPLTDPFTGPLICIQPEDEEQGEEGPRHRKGRLGMGTAALHVVMCLLRQQEREATQRLLQWGVGRAVQDAMAHLQHSMQVTDEEGQVLELLQRVSVLLDGPQVQEQASGPAEVGLVRQEEDWSGLQSLCCATTQVLSSIEQACSQPQGGSQTKRRAPGTTGRKKRAMPTPAGDSSISSNINTIKQSQNPWALSHPHTQTGDVTRRHAQLIGMPRMAVFTGGRTLPLPRRG